MNETYINIFMIVLFNMQMKLLSYIMITYIRLVNTLALRRFILLYVCIKMPILWKTKLLKSKISRALNNAPVGALCEE